MSTTVKTGWLNNKNGDKFAPKTLISQVQTSDGVLLEDKIQADLDAAKNVQADWEQNDNTSGSYINNRPFYVIDSTEVTLLDGTFEFSQNYNMYIFFQDSTIIFEVGKEYTVIFDGVNYTCTANYGDACVALGNDSIYGEEIDYSKEPFVMNVDEGVLYIFTYLTDASHTVVIKTNDESVKQLQKKYIPDYYLYKYNPVAVGSFSLNRQAGTTVGEYSFVEGVNSTASGMYSHAEGLLTIASGKKQHVQGMCNIEDADSVYAHIVGNGTVPAPSNAHTLDWSGNAWFQGDVYTGSTSGTNKDEGSKKLATEEYVDTLNSSSQNTWYGTCTTAAAIAAKVVTTTTGDFTLKEGATVYVLFNTAHTSTSRITLNVDGTGDIAVNLSSTNGMTAHQIAAKQVVCFVYDGESFRVQGGSLATTTYYGLTKLSSSTSSTSTTMAATPSAVKVAYDLAAAAAPKSTLVSTTISNWAATVTYSNNAITATSPIELLPGTDISADQLKALQAANIIGGVQSAGQIELKVMGTVPTVEIPVQFIIRGDL